MNLTGFDDRLYGLTVHQTYRYFRLYQSDIPILVYLVSFYIFRIMVIKAEPPGHIGSHNIVNAYAPAMLSL